MHGRLILITKDNLKHFAEVLGFQQNAQNPNFYDKTFPEIDATIRIDFYKGEFCYPEEKGFSIGERTTCNFSQLENFVVFECVCRLFDKGYRPESIILEKAWKLGHAAKSGRADICIKDMDNKHMLAIIECKTPGKEYQKEKKNMQSDGGQLFSYWQQERSTKWLILYTSDFDTQEISYQTESVHCEDDPNILKLSQKDESIEVYKNANTVAELFSVWDETYDKAFAGDVLFNEDTRAYEIGVRAIRKKDLIDFAESNNVVNAFEEILRHNNVSDKENAFNRLVALFICKLVDEITKHDNDEVEFQYRPGTDSYESLQDRLQRLHQQGMKQFMQENIFYLPDDYAQNLVQQYTGQNRANMIADLQEHLRQLKYYSNNDFAFKDVHNEELFYQNGKVLVEVVQLFQPYRIINSSRLQLLGDLFEQLLNKGFKQNEGQFFTPVPITKFIWYSLPLEKIIYHDEKIYYPKIIDYACGAGHFLTEGAESINAIATKYDTREQDPFFWVRDHLYGVEKDYRLARVSKISLFMHGAGNGNIIFGDGLENYPEKNIKPGTFDVLVANPPYSVAAFKPHLKLKNNTFTTLDKISNSGSEIETLFVERIAQLLKPNGYAAVILPSSILNKENESFISARESILKNFYIRAIVQLGSKTFGATGTNTVTLFLQKFDEPPKRTAMIKDSIIAIFEQRNLNNFEDHEILDKYLTQIAVEADVYQEFLSQNQSCGYWQNVDYFKDYLNAMKNSATYKNKIKQKDYKQKSDQDKEKWKSEYFYQFAVSLEKEKLTYFAFVYQQTTLIITAPSDNKGQEEFLGYSWSNRKGQEGIQIKNYGGMMFDDEDMGNLNNFSGLIRESFYSKQRSVKCLQDQYYYLYTKDMLNFESVDFKNTISLNSLGNYIIKSKFDSIKLKDIAPYVTEKISYSAIEPSTYITTDNMLQEKAGVIIYNGKPAIDKVIKYQKNDILISNIRPYLKKIWLADTEGGCSTDILVFRVNNVKKILPKYLYIVLSDDTFFEFMMAGKKGMKMPRGDKNKIEEYPIPVPPIEIQKQIIGEFDAIGRAIQAENEKIRKCDFQVNDKFVEMFVGSDYNAAPLKDIVSVQSGLWRGKKPPFIRAHVIRNTNFTMQGKLDYTDVALIDVEKEQLEKHLLQKGDIIIEKSGGSSNQAVGRVVLFDLENAQKYTYSNFTSRLRIKDKSIINSVYLHSFLNYFYQQGETFNYQKGISELKNLDMNRYLEINVKIPPMKEQIAYSNFVYEQSKNKIMAQKQKARLQKQRTNLLDKYFM